MKKGTLLAALGRRTYWVLVLLLGLAVASCRTCPMESCHVRKVHTHNGVRYRGQPMWKMQNPAIGEKIKLNSEGKSKRRSSDHSKSLK
jgi:hypothetical protein